MPIESQKECKNCGRSYPQSYERCPKCTMYWGEDVDMFNKFKSLQEEALDNLLQ